MKKTLIVVFAVLMFTFSLLPYTLATTEKRVGVYWLTNSIDVSPSTTGTWNDVCVKSYIPQGFHATGVILEIYNTYSVTRYGDVRMKGSTDDFTSEGMIIDTENTRGLFFCGLDDSGTFQAKISGREVKIKLLGFTDDSVQYFTNVVDKTPVAVNRWVDVDVSDIVPEEATGVIVRIMNPSHIDQCVACNVRAVGSVDDLTYVSGSYGFGVFGCGSIFQGVALNNMKKFQFFTSDKAFVGWEEESKPCKLFIAAYTTDPIVWLVNKQRVPLNEYDQWVTVTAPFKSTVVFIDVLGTGVYSDVKEIGGTATEKRIMCAEHVLKAVKVDSEGKFQVYGGTVPYHFFKPRFYVEGYVSTSGSGFQWSFILFFTVLIIMVVVLVRRGKKK